MPVNWYSVNEDFQLNGIDFKKRNFPLQISPFKRNAKPVNWDKILWYKTGLDWFDYVLIVSRLGENR